MKMPAEMKAKWLDALRSGKYTQCHRQLFDGKGYCCLGVLEKICDGEVETASDGRSRTMPSCEWYDSHKISCMFDSYEGGVATYEGYLALMNDGTSPKLGKYDFLEIADWIEKNVEVSDRE